MTDNGNQEAAVAVQPSRWQEVLAELQALGRAPQPRPADEGVLNGVREIEASMTSSGMASLAAATGAEMERLAFLDSLTELYTSRAFIKELKNALKRAARYDQPLSLCMLSIDGFQEIVSRLGNLTGDAVLRVASKVISESMRDNDLAARYTADQFAIILPDTTCASASMIADRLRQKIGTQAMSHNWQSLKITCSAGVASFPLHAQDQDMLIALAIQALGSAVQRGGDRVCIL